MSTIATTAPDLDDACTHLLARIRLWARLAWRQQHQCADLSDYEDAGREALTRCLARFDPARGVPFASYAQTRIWWAIRTSTHRAPVGLLPAAWRLPLADRDADLLARVEALPGPIRAIAEGLLHGDTQAVIAARVGCSPSALSRQLRTFRQQK